MPTRHRFAWLPLLLSASLAGCDSDGSGSERVTILYSGDRPAYGLVIRSGSTANARSSTGETCTASAAATAAGCRSEVATTANGLDLTLDGCFVEAGDAVFDCQLSPELADTLRSASVHAGCGCGLCPNAPSIDVCDSGAAECAEPSASGNTAASRKPDSTVTSRPAVRSTTCSTCCETDFYDDEIGTVTSDRALSEIAFDVTFSEECAFDFNGAAECELLDSVYDDWSMQEFGDGRLVKRFCFAGRMTATDALSLPLVSCRGNIEDIQVTRALGPDFMPLENPPTIRFE